MKVQLYWIPTRYTQLKHQVMVHTLSTNLITAAESTGTSGWSSDQSKALSLKVARDGLPTHRMSTRQNITRVHSSWFRRMLRSYTGPVPKVQITSGLTSQEPESKILHWERSGHENFAGRRSLCSIPLVICTLTVQKTCPLIICRFPSHPKAYQ